MNPYFQPEWIAYFISIIAIGIAAYAVYLVVELREYVLLLKQHLKSNVVQENTYSSKIKRK